jgi:integrase
MVRDRPEGGAWTIPGERMKAGKAHTVPLSDRAVEILRGAVEAVGAGGAGSDFIFLNGGGKPLSNMAMAELVKGMGIRSTVHGFRSSFRTWADEQTTYDHHTKETALAHVTHQSKVEQAYNRSDALTKRRRLMAEWSRYCEGRGVAGDNVVAIRA